MTKITDKIFSSSFIYKCIVPYGATLNDKEVEEYGIRGTGVKEVDDRLQNQPTVVYLNIARMVDLYSSYYNITICSNEDAKTIYLDIVAYLEVWHEFITRSTINSTNVPVDDLIALDDFAKAIRPMALGATSTHAKELDYPVNDDLSKALGALDKKQVNRYHVVEDAEGHNDSLREFFKNYANVKMGLNRKAGGGM